MYRSAVPPEACYVDSDGIARIKEFVSVVKESDEVPAEHTVLKTGYLPAVKQQARVSFNLLKSTSQTPTFTTDVGVTHLSRISFDTGIHLPYEQRLMDIEYKFGGTEIQVLCKHQHTGEVKTRRLTFNA